MAGPAGDDMRVHHSFGEHQISEQVEHLVPRRLVGKPGRGEIPLRPDAQRVACGRAARQAGPLQRLQLVSESPGARRCNLVYKLMPARIDVHDLRTKPACPRCGQMLHRAHRRALPQRDTALRVAHHAGGRFDRGGGGTVHAHKHDAGAERGRLAHHRRGISAVNANARARHRPADRPLRNRDHPALRWRGGESVCSIRCSAACCLRPSRWGRAAFPENTAPSGTSLVTADLARIVARAPMWTWSFTPICPANTAPSPMMTLPAIPHWATITTPRPTVTLWATCTRLSIFVPAP